MINNNRNNTPATTTPEVDPGFTFDTAFDLGVADNGLIVEETLGDTDQGDIYTFSIDEAGQYNLSLDGLTADADLWLLDDLGTAIDVSDALETQSESISTQLTPGDYQVVAYSYDGAATDYTLEIDNGPATATSESEQIETFIDEVIAPDADPGFTFDTALDLGTVDGELMVSDRVGGNDEGDVFAFTVEEGGLYNVSLDGLSADADLVLTDADGQAINFSQMEGSENELISAQLNSGTYYAIAESYDGVATDYTLGVSFYDPVGIVEPEPGTTGVTEAPELFPFDPFDPIFEPIDPGFNPGFEPFNPGLESIRGIGGDPGYNPFFGLSGEFDFDDALSQGDIRQNEFLEAIYE